MNASMPRVLCTNDYSMQRAVERWRAGEYPAEHSWGAAVLPVLGWVVELLPEEPGPVVRRLQRGRLRIVLDQFRLAWRARRVDAVFAASQYETLGLALLRRLRILPAAVVVTIHHPIRGLFRNRLVFGLLYRGHDAFVCLSTTFEKELTATFGVDPARVSTVPMGADLEYYDRVRRGRGPRSEALVVSAGKTKRDFDTLVAAFTDLPARLEIFCSTAAAPGAVPRNVAVHHAHATQAVAVDGRTLVEKYEDASVVAIPLIASNDLAGLTALLEAMAIGRPVVMTHNPAFDIDIEAEGIGLWVAPGDVAGWRDAICRLVEDRELAGAMGERARRLCEARYSHHAYAAELARVLRAATARRAGNGG